MASGIKKTNEEFIAEITKMYNGQYELLESYINDTTKIKFQCHNCGAIFTIKPNNILHGHGCPECAAKESSIKLHKKYKAHFEEIMHEKFSDEFKILGEYINAHTQISVEHISCGTVFMVTPCRFTQKNPIVACPKCGKTNKKTTEGFKEQLKEKYGEKEFIVLGEYVNNHTKILIQHNKCGHIFSTTPNSLLTGHGCPFCCQSKGEKIIKIFLEQHQIIFIQQHWFPDCRYINPLKFDFFLPELQKAIEFDGEQHFMAKTYCGGEKGLKERQKRDAIKNQYCIDHNIELLRIAFNENIEEKLKNFLNIN